MLRGRNDVKCAVTTQQRSSTISNDMAVVERSWWRHFAELAQQTQRQSAIGKRSVGFSGQGKNSLASRRTVSGSALNHLHLRQPPPPARVNVNGIQTFVFHGF